MPVRVNRQLPVIQGVRWFNLGVLIFTPAIAAYGLWSAPRSRETMIFAFAYYVFSMLGITAGYHRLWSHRSYNASTLLQLFLVCGGSSAVQGSCCWWARSHRSHHRYTDTDLDPYDANRGLLWTHIGWMIFKSDLRSGKADISDLQKDKLIQWQHRWYFSLALFFGYILPTIIPGLFWNDWLGGFCFAGALRLTIAHHSTFCINSIAHYLGSASYDDVLTPRDHLLSAILTMGEGYHNFHHQFPMDYRNAYLWYQYDPTKWFIAICSKIGLASHLRVFPSNEIAKGALAMKLKELKKVQDCITWPVSPQALPVVTWETFQDESKTRTLVLVAGFIHDVSSFIDNHPGGKNILLSSSGKDVTGSFFGGVYTHSNAAHNLLSMMRVGVLAGGVETSAETVLPSQRLYISQRSKGS
ncbi:putative stearyl-CoA desaturase that utilizes O(2) and electrons from reduced cytochrome b5 to introduce the first double bond into saturated fatty acyl-CoA substrates [Lyophyllum shimeji]|uniref:Acyl-CoA desaturase n=1 Tax=Lyophyllum shimeji TaxID=47721 RepID=A0A9P3PSQ3_LYOSH|nr:putative stearyl-CoA desaturase that utilizes O(2) and electrons from reduced cytochrome b5 to introduce the first double bond into saturated fatty acyl-CoA substrates [Lyophyllum shimeji]